MALDELLHDILSGDRNLNLRRLKDKRVRLYNVKTGKWGPEFPYGEPSHPIPQVLWFLEQCGLAEITEEKPPAKVREIIWKVNKHTGVFRNLFVTARCTACTNDMNVEITNKAKAEAIKFKCQCSKVPVPIPADVLEAVLSGKTYGVEQTA